jgi:hypothetical protein
MRFLTVVFCRSFLAAYASDSVLDQYAAVWIAVWKTRERLSFDKPSSWVEVKSPEISLLRKEVRRYLSCTIYLFNTAFGPLLLIIFAAAVAIMDRKRLSLR